MTEGQKEKLWELIEVWLLDDTSGVDLEYYVTELIAEAYQAGREDERKAVRLWGVK